MLQKCFVQKLWREKANKLSMCLPRHHMAPSEISKTGPFLVLSKSNGRLQATWQSMAASYQSFSRTACTGLFAFVVFRIFSVTCSLTRALSQSLAHA